MIALLFASGALAGMHPPVTLLDATWTPVTQTGGAVSTAATCGQCHDTEWIAKHSFHSSMDFDHQVPAGTAASGRAWDLGTGPGTRWNPLLPDVVPGMDAATLQDRLAPYLVGGGAISPDLEMNCFVCHTPTPDNGARVDQIRSGHPEWAVTATLQGLGLVKPGAAAPAEVPTDAAGETTPVSGAPWSYDLSRFTPDGQVNLSLGPPSSENCGACHGTVHKGKEALLLDFDGRGTRSAGRVFSAQRISASSLNVAHKEDLTRAWDAHAERMLDCTDCHYSLNHPAYYQESEETRPNYLRFDGRKLSMSAYLHRPSHDFAKGFSVQGHLAEDLDGSMRGCTDCHDASATHDWLPYKEQHFEALACESCHIPAVYSPALSGVDHTLVTAKGEPVFHWRGVEGDPADPAALVTGWTPVLLPRADRDGRPKLTPHNLITSVAWVAGDPAKPLDTTALAEALLVGGQHHPDLIAALDGNGDKTLSEAELVLDTDAKVEAVKARLVAAGHKNPVIHGELEAFGVHHGVTGTGYANKECTTCHAEDGRTGSSFALAAALPPGVTPALVADSAVTLDGEVVRAENGAWTYEQNVLKSGFYLFGQHRITYLDLFGLLTVVGSVFGLGGHGLGRYIGARLRRRS